MSPTRGQLLVLEGAEGAGKTTQIQKLLTFFATRSVPVASFREPGGTPLGEEIRQLLLDASFSMSARAEALLFTASRAELVEREIMPRLAAGELVILDRFFLSTYAYQIAGRGLSEEEVRRANDLARAGVVPDLTLLLVVPDDELARRASMRGMGDRMEQAGDLFHERVAAALATFLDPAWQATHPECGPVVAVNASGTEDEVFARILNVLPEV
ncbi:MAG: dTMP kinase [Gemmatimonadaceae bacterium]